MRIKKVKRHKNLMEMYDTARFVTDQDGNEFTVKPSFKDTNKVILKNKDKSIEIDKKELDNYTVMDGNRKTITENIEPAQNVAVFMSTPIEELNLNTVKLAVDDFFNDYNKLPQGMDALDPQYYDQEGEFYGKYYEFAKKCNDVSKLQLVNVSGYGSDDATKLKIKDLCSSVDYRFPYGWKNHYKPTGHNITESLGNSLRDANIETLEYLIEFDYAFPFPNSFAGSGWQDWLQWLTHGLENDIEIAENLIQYLKKDVDFSNKHKDVYEDDPQSELTISVYTKLKTALEKELARYNDGEESSPPRPTINPRYAIPVGWNQIFDPVYRGNCFTKDNVLVRTFWQSSTIYVYCKDDNNVYRHINTFSKHKKAFEFAENVVNGVIEIDKNKLNKGKAFDYNRLIKSLEIRKQKDPIEEAYEGKYSDKFRSLIKKYFFENNVEAMNAVIKDIIRYTPEEDLKDLWFDRGYARDFDNDESDIEESLPTNNFKVGDRVKQAHTSTYNVGTVTKALNTNGLQYEVKWDYSDGDDIEILDPQDIAPYNEEDEKLGLYESTAVSNEYDLNATVRYLDTEIPEISEELLNLLINMRSEDITKAANACRNFYAIAEMLCSKYNSAVPQRHKDERALESKKCKARKDNALLEAIDEKDILHRLDQFQGSITVKTEDEETLRDILLKKNISFIIDDSNPGKSRFKLRYKSLKEKLNSNKGTKQITEDIGEPLEGPSEGAEFGLASSINVSIQKELETINEYDSLAINARAEGYDDIAKVIDHITTEEYEHITELQEVLKTLAPNAKAMDDADHEDIEEGLDDSRDFKTWQDVYKHFKSLEASLNDAEAVTALVDEEYRTNKGNEIYEIAYKKWCDGE